MFTAIFRLIAFAGVCSIAGAATELDREIVLTPHAGVAPEDTEITRWQDRAGRADARAEIFERLAWAFVAKARHTLDAGFYKLAEKTIDVSETKFGASPETRLLRGHVLHNLHRFREAERVARQLVSERGWPVDFGLLSDALIEQGKLAEGVTALQRMLDLKPGAEAYSRIAHARWLKGDLAGAMTAMESALKATDPRDAETRAWLFTRLSGFSLQCGEATVAFTFARRASQYVADYPPALLACGRALIALGRIDEAIDPITRAESLQPLPEYQWWLADALTACGRDAEAAKVEERLKARGAENDPRTLALFLATRRNQPTEALRLARAELKARPDVFTHDVLAWALAAAGEVEAAGAEMRLALAEHTNDARLLLHAGEIALAQGDRGAAAAHFVAADRVSATLTPSERVLLAQRQGLTAEVAAR